MSEKNFMAYGDAESILTEYANRIKLSPSIFGYTRAEWELLTDEQKAQYDYTAFEDDITDLDDATKLSNEIAANNKLLNDTVGWTGKNFVRLPYVNTESVSRGITFTASVDGTVAFSGTGDDAGTGYIQLIDISKTLYLPAGSYILSDGGNAYGGVQIYLYDNANGASRYTGTISGSYISSSAELYICTTQDTTYAWSESNTYGYDKLFTIGSPAYARVIGRSVNNSYASAVSGTIYPMIRRADISDGTYEPYHNSVETMYEEDVHGINLFKPDFTTKTSNGVTYTVNGDNSISTSGTTTADTRTPIGTIFLEKGIYTLSGNPYKFEGTTETNKRLRLFNADESKIFWDDGDGVTFTIDKAELYTLAIRYGNGLSFGSTFKPMIRKADIDDPTYRPFNEQSIQNQLNNQTGVLGAKNLLNNTAATQTVNNVAFTVNSDKTVSVARTAEQTEIATKDLYVVSDDDYRLLAGKTLIMTGCPSGGSNDTYYLECYYNDGTGHWLRDIGDGLTITLPATKPTTIKFLIGIKVASVIPSGGLTFKPMIRLASDPDDTYQLYTLTNRELTERTFPTVQTTTVNSTNFSSGDITYAVKDGWCHVSIYNLKAKATGQSKEVATGLPKVKLRENMVSLSDANGNASNTVWIDTTISATTLKGHFANTTASFGTLVYMVDED